MSGPGKGFNVIVKCELEEVSHTVDLCIARIEEHVDQAQIDPEMIARIKWVITEMVTNAIKHSGVEECTLTIRANPEELIIEKQESGHPFALSEYSTGRSVSWPLQHDQFPQNFQLYHSGSESLWANAPDPHHAVFIVKEIGRPHMPALLADTSEHFGLLILTKASDAFEYRHESGTNHFRSTFKLKKD